MDTGKVAVLVVWVLFAASFFVATDSSAAAIGRTGFWVMAVAHAVECGAFFPRLRRAPGTLAGNLAATFVFGFLHLRTLQEGVGDRAGES